MKQPGILRRILRRLGWWFVPANDPALEFHAPRYLQESFRRTEHLASLDLPVAGKSVLEVGAGIGDFTYYFQRRGCRMTITDGRESNVAVLKELFPDQQCQVLNLESPSGLEEKKFDVVFCYGLLYHLNAPGPALDFLASTCGGILLLETCLSFGEEEAENLLAEDRKNPSQAISGIGCRPTRSWVYNRLKKSFAHVYVTRDQPNDVMYPIDWARPEIHPHALVRGVFVASHQPIESDRLIEGLPPQQQRQT